MLGGSGISKCIHGAAKYKLFNVKTIRKNWPLIPLVFLQACAIIAIPLMGYHRLFVTTIDVQLTDYQRFEIPSVPRFIDLRKPRSLKLMTITEPKPAIDLDNRYRLMRGEPPLEADDKIDKIG